MTELVLFTALGAIFAALLDDNHDTGLICRMICFVLSGIFLVLEAKNCSHGPRLYFSKFTNL